MSNPNRNPASAEVMAQKTICRFKAWDLREVSVDEAVEVLMSNAPYAGDPPRPLLFRRPPATPAGQGNLQGPVVRPHSALCPADYGAGRRIVKREGMRTEATGRARMHRSLAGAAAHHTRLSLSSCRIHGTTRFQLAPVWSTILRSRALTPKRELRLGKPREGCRAVASQATRRRACSPLNELRLGKPSVT